MIDKDRLINLLLENDYSVEYSRRYKNCAYRIKLSTGAAIFAYDRGGFFCQGNDVDGIRELIESATGLDEPNCKVFVAYGHDEVAKHQLELMLRQMNLQPLFIDQLPTEGRTIIEQLEAYIPQANYGIVLMTPDDIAHPSDDCNSIRFRARQNVVLELGMMYMRLGRKHVAIVLKQCNGEIEYPSDISGVLRLEYTNNVNEVREQLTREMNGRGYEIEL